MQSIHASSNNNNSDTNDILTKTEFITLANGLIVPRESPSALVEELRQACQDGSLAEVDRILNEITPLRIDNIPPVTYIALQGCLRTAVEQHHPEIVRAMLQREGGFLTGQLLHSSISAAFHAADTAMLKIFVDCGWDVNDVTGSGHPLLRNAVNSPDVRRFLLMHGASPNVPNNRGLTPLETAVQWSTAEVVQELLEYGGDPSTDNSLIYAAEVGRIDVAELLLQKGADVNAVPKVLPYPWAQERQHNALEAAMMRNHQHMVQWLKDHGAKS